MPAPTNDLCVNATTIAALPYVVTGVDTTSATQSGDDPYNYAIATVAWNSVWWTWTAPSDLWVTVSTHDSDYGTALGVYTGTCGSLSVVVANRRDGTGAITSLCRFWATSGTTYYVVAGSDSDNGGGTLTFAVTGASLSQLTQRQGSSDGPDATPSAAAIITLPFDVVAGHLLVVMANSWYDAPITAITDTLGNTYSHGFHVLQPIGTQAPMVDVWYCAESIGSGPCSVTVTCDVSASTLLTRSVAEFTGGPYRLDGAAVTNTGSEGSTTFSYATSGAQSAAGLLIAGGTFSTVTTDTGPSGPEGTNSTSPHMNPWVTSLARNPIAGGVDREWYRRTTVPESFGIAESITLPDASFAGGVLSFLSSAPPPPAPTLPTATLVNSTPCCSSNGSSGSATGPILQGFGWVPVCAGGGNLYDELPDLTDSENWDV